MAIRRLQPTNNDEIMSKSRRTLDSITRSVPYRLATLSRVMIKTVIFDLGKVIVPFDFSRGYRAMSALSGHSPEEIRARIISTDLVRRCETGHRGAEAFR